MTGAEIDSAPTAYKFIRKLTKMLGTIKTIKLSKKITILPPFILLFFPFIHAIKPCFQKHIDRQNTNYNSHIFIIPFSYFNFPLKYIQILHLY